MLTLHRLRQARPDEHGFLSSAKGEATSAEQIQPQSTQSSKRPFDQVVGKLSRTRLHLPATAESAPARLHNRSTLLFDRAQTRRRQLSQHSGQKETPED